MTVKCICPHCQQSYKVRQDKLGKTTACQKCGESFELQRSEANSVSGTAETPSESPNKKPTDSVIDRLRDNPTQTGSKISRFGAGLILLSMPFAWTVAYSTGFGGGGSLSTRGWLMAIPAIGLFGLIHNQKQSPENIKKNAKMIGGLSLMVFLYASYTVLSVMSVGSSNFGGMTAGVKTGAGVWFAIIGSMACGVGQVFLTQADLLSPTTKDGKSRSWSDSFKEIGERAKQEAEKAQKAAGKNENEKSNSNEDS